MKSKLVVFVLVVVAMICTTLYANDKANGLAKGKIIVSGWITGANNCSIDVYQVAEDGSQVRISSNEFSLINYYKVKLEPGNNYILVFNNGEFTKHLKIENVRIKERFLIGRRTHLIMDVDFTNRNSAKIEQHGGYFKFYDRL
jgi:hypothetical protein